MEVSFTDNYFAIQTVKFINNTDSPVFLTGKAGTGKTTLLQYIINHTHKNVVVVAPTGIAAINAGGVTIHSMFQLPFGSFLPTDNIDLAQEKYLEFHTPTQLLKKSKLNSKKRRLIHQIELLVIDEVSMLRADILDAIDLIMRFVRRNKLPFGGAQVLFIGDMLQLPPVVKDMEWQLLRRFYRSAYFFDAHVLQKYVPQVIELDKIYRQRDAEFIRILNNLRENKVSENDIRFLNTFYIKDFAPKPAEHYITLTTHNIKANTINEQKLNEIDLPVFTYNAIVEGDFPEKLYPIDSTMLLKKGAQVMFIKNDYSGEQRYFNGKIGQISDLTKKKVYVTFNTGSENIEVEPYTWENKRYVLNQKTNEIEEEIIGKFIHFPLKLAWAVTIHKSQGLTFEKAVIDVSDAFAPGQMYVALSRLQSLNGLVLSAKLIDDGPKQDQLLLEFTKRKADEKMLEENLETATRRYLFNFILITFDYTDLREAIKEHIKTYDKDESRSEKQKHLSWIEDFQTKCDELDKIAQKFSNQILKIINNKEQNLFFLQERLLAAKTFFSPKLFELSSHIFKHISLIDNNAGVKEYISELRYLESFVFDRSKRINKSIVILKSIINNLEIPAQTQANVSLIEERQKCIFNSKSNKPTIKNTRKITLELFKTNMSIEQIAKERELTIKTVVKHLAYYVSSGTLSPTEFMSFEKLSTIEDLIREKQTRSIKQLYSYLPAGFEEWEVKIALAGFESGNL